MRTHIFLNLHHLIAAAWRRRYVIVVPVLIVPVLALTIGAMTPKKYHNHTTVLIQETTKLNPFLADFSVSTQLKERMAALTALLHSRHMLTEVALELGFINDPESREAAAEIKKLSDALSVLLIGSDMIKLNYVSYSPDQMEQVLTVVSKYFLGKLLAPERSSIDASESFLEEQLAQQQASLLKAETRLTEFKAANSARLPDQYSFDVQQLRDSEKLLREKQTELAGAKATLNSLNTQVLKTNPMLASIEEEIIRKRSELTLLRSRYTDRHSAVIAASKALSRIESEREALLTEAGALTSGDVEKLWQLASNMTVSDSATSTRPLLVSQMEAIETAKSKERQLVEETEQLTVVIAQLKSKLEVFAGIEQSMRELQRDIATKQSLYDDFLKRHEMAKVTGALGRFEENDRVKVIDRPFTPRSPVNLPLIIYFVAGIFGGLFLGCGLALLLEISNTTVIRRDMVEKLIGVPVLTRLPRVPESALLQIE